VEPESLSTEKLHDFQLGAQPDFSVVLVCWNNKSYLKPCLDSLYEGNLHHQYEVVVVDNGSTDGSQEMLRDDFPQVKIIQNDRNVGLGKASNQGIEATVGWYVLLLNNDTLVNGASLDAMVEFMDSHLEVGAVGGRLLNPDGSFQAANSKFPSLSEELLIATRIGSLFWPNFPDRSYPRDITLVEWMGSACLLLRREALSKIGLLDETYFIYGDEADLQYRLKKAGWKVYYLPNVTTIHYGGRSMDRWKRRKMVYRGKMLFFRKNYGELRTGLLRMMLAALSLGKMLVWGAAYFIPGKRDLSRKELHSNAEIIGLCWKLA
jgi:N-acetylglucosaminyl-diphospho-decaprenol L-rhamnosyltransferase